MSAKTTHNKNVPGNSSLLHTLYPYLILAAGTFLLYAWTVRFGFNLDDDYIITSLAKLNNSEHPIKDIFNSWYANGDYRPVTILSFWLEQQLFGAFTPASGHAMNVFIYFILLSVLYRLILTLRWTEDEQRLKTLALITCIFFLVHPNHVSVVANIKSRDNLLSMLLGMAAAIQLIKAYDFRQYYRILFFLLLISLALLCKRDAYSFAIIPLVSIFLFRKTNWKHLIAAGIITYILFLISFGVREFFISQLDYELTDKTALTIAENPLIGNNTFLNTLSLTFTSLFYYLKFLLIPFGYHFYFGSYAIELTPLFSWQNICAFILLAAWGGWSVYKYKTQKLYLFSFLFFCLSIAYAINFFEYVAGIVMDRYNFIASLGFCILLATAILETNKEFISRPFNNKIILLIITIWSIFTYYRTSAWRDYFTLFERDMPHLTKSVVANRIVAGTYIHFALKEETKPDFDRAMTDKYIATGEKYAQQSLANSDRSPLTWELLGLVDLYRRNDTAALTKFRQCYALDSNFLSGVNYLGFTFWNTGQIDSAYHYFSMVMNKEGFFNYSANNLINMLVKNNRQQEADSILHVLKQRFPEDPNLQKKIEEVNSAKINFPAP